MAGLVTGAIPLVAGIAVAIAAIFADHHFLRRFRACHLRTLLSLKGNFCGALSQGLEGCREKSEVLGREARSLCGRKARELFPGRCRAERFATD